MHYTLLPTRNFFFSHTTFKDLKKIFPDECSLYDSVIITKSHVEFSAQLFSGSRFVLALFLLRNKVLSTGLQSFRLSKCWHGVIHVMCRWFVVLGLCQVMFHVQGISGTHSDSVSVLQVSEVLESDQLNVRNEELVFDAVCRWIDFDRERRKGHIARLLKTIRLGLLTTQFFVEKVSKCPGPLSYQTGFQ